MSKRILAVGAHSDDLEATSGGTVAKLIHSGDEVFFLILSNGAKGVHRLNAAKKKLIKLREKEARESAECLGVKEVIFLGFEDGEIENTPVLMKSIVKVIRKVKPDIVFGFDPSNQKFDSFHRFHRDHRMAGEAVFDAVFPAAGNLAFFPDLAKEGYKPHTIKELWFFGTANPNKFIDIGQTLNKKIEALFRHASQLDKEEMQKKVKMWAKKIGKGKGYAHAEAFRVLKL